MSKRKPKIAEVPAAREKVFALTERNSYCMRAVLIGAGVKINADEKLAEVTAALGTIAAGRTGTNLERASLIQLFGFTFGWLNALGVKMPYLAIHQERERQELLFRNGQHLFTCASPVASSTRKLRVLTEEVGEVAKALDQLEFAEDRKSLAIQTWRRELETELVQVAAVTVAWLESLEGK